MRRLFCGLFLLASMTRLVAAGTLTEFEQDAIRKNKPSANPDSRPNRPEHHGSGEESFEDSLASSALSFIVAGIGYGGGCSLDRMSGQDNEFRSPGEALIPVFRLDASYQAAESSVRALDLRGETGYGPIGGQIRYTRYQERNPSDTLSATQAHVLYRMSFGSHVEIDLGPGLSSLDGRDHTTGFSFALPILVHPSEHYGFEFRPAWSKLNGNPIRDYDLAVLLGKRYFSFKLGYRWFLSEHSSLSGPQAGFVARW